MINLGTKICFKAMCISYDDNANEYHFKILKINIPFTVVKSEKVFKVEKSAMFKAICVYADEIKYSFTLDSYASNPPVIDFPRTGQKNNRDIYCFLKKSRILHLLYFWKK